MRDAFTETATMARLFLRRDRVTLAIWIAVVALIPVSLGASVLKLYPTAEALRAYADLSNGTAATIGVLGFVYRATAGGLVAWRTGLNSVFLIAPVAILYAVRYTRTEENSGRSELLRSGPVGRLAPVAATLAVIFGATLAMAILIAGGLTALGFSFTGALVLGLSAASAGWVFGSLAAVVAQLTATSGAARGISFAVLAIAWITRATGDLRGAHWLTWVSPLGWVRMTLAFAGDRWWVLALPIALAIVLTAAALALAYRRDLGAALAPERLGPAEAPRSLDSALALTWRLQRGALAGWMAAAAGFGLLLGAIGNTISGFVDAPAMRAWAASLGVANPGDAFLFLTMYILGEVVAAYAIASVLRARSEETEGRADMLLAEPVDRRRWAGGHLGIALLGSALILGVMGAAIGLAYGLSTGNLSVDMPRLFLRTMMTLPAVWVMAGIATAFYGFAPKYAWGVTWTVFGVFLALELAWEVRAIGPLVFGVSPFAHVYWASPVSAVALVALVVVAAALCVLGLFGLRRRDFG